MTLEKRFFKIRVYKISLKMFRNIVSILLTLLFHNFVFAFLNIFFLRIFTYNSFKKGFHYLSKLFFSIFFLRVVLNKIRWKLCGIKINHLFVKYAPIVIDVLTKSRWLSSFRKLSHYSNIVGPTILRRKGDNHTIEKNVGFSL